jgi:hypothetical protein
MFRWIAGFFGLEPIKNPIPLDSTISPSFEYTVEQTSWPEGSQLRKRLRFHEPDGWAHSNWSWRSNGYIDHPGSLHPRQDKAECRHCLGALKCQGCGKILRPCTKSADMRAQLDRPCPDLTCGDVLQWFKCEARSYRFAADEGGMQYSIWEHTGSHLSHPRPPPGRRPARSVPMPPTATRTHRKLNVSEECSGPSTGASRVNRPAVGKPCITVKSRKAPITPLQASDAPRSSPTQRSGDRVPQASGSTVTQSLFYLFYFLRWDMI